MIYRGNTPAHQCLDVVHAVTYAEHLNKTPVCNFNYRDQTVYTDNGINRNAEWEWVHGTKADKCKFLKGVMPKLKNRFEGIENFLHRIFCGNTYVVTWIQLQL